MAESCGELDTEQRAAVAAVGGPVCIIAGAGTGKTRTVTHRLAQAVSSGAVSPVEALAITHSRKAAGELGERLHALGIRGVDALTFHAAGLKVIRRYWDHAGRPEAGPTILGEGDAWRAWRDAARAVTRSEPDNPAVRDLIDEVGWARARRLDAGRYPGAAARAGRHPGVPLPTVVACWEAYERTKARSGQLDFADLLELAAGLIEGDEGIAATVRRRWAHVTVDEYQDTDPAQQRLLDAIVGESQELCVVGDPRQAIYSWRGADPSYLTGFVRRYPTARVFDLTRNYRSSPQILDWANRIAPSPGTRPLTPTRPGGRIPKVTRLDSEAAEAAWVAGAARRAIASGTAAGEIAVLYRFNATQARFEAALARAGIATTVAADTTFFDREEVRAVLRPFGQAARAQPGSPGVELLVSFLGRAGFDPDRPPEGFGAARARWESHQALLDLVRSSPDMADADADGLLAQINALAVATHGPSIPGVTLATLHRAKGLEWDVVFMVGMTKGAMPSSFAETTEELAEEERLLHVGITRARRELYLTWPASNGRGWDNQPSPLLDLLARPVESRPRAGGRKSAAGRDRRSRAEPAGPVCPHCAEPLKGAATRRLGVCPSCVTRAPGPLGQRARALNALAGEAARATGVPKIRVLSSSGLVRLLHQQPTSPEEVAATPGVDLPAEWARRAAGLMAE